MASKYNAMALLLIALTILFTVVGQLLVKLGMTEVSALPAPAASTLAMIGRAFTNFKVVSGLSCAVIAAVCWMLAVSKSDLSFAYPFMGLAIVLVLALSPLVLGETVPIKRWGGVALVCIGLWLAAQK